MTTPIYNGGDQPAPSGGGWFGSWFGGTPTYRGVGQPAQKASSLLGGSQPVYQTGPSADTSSQGVDGNGCGPIAIVIPRQLMEPQQ